MADPPAPESLFDHLVEECFEDPDQAVFWFDPPGLLRQARRFADLSQRQLAERMGISRSVIGRIESGKGMPRLDLYRRMLAAMRIAVVPLYADGREVIPMAPYAIRDAAGRHFPAHLDVRNASGWWYMGFDPVNYPVPLATFTRVRQVRDNWRTHFGLAPEYIDDRLELYRKHGGRRSRKPRTEATPVGELTDWW